MLIDIVTIHGFNKSPLRLPPVGEKGDLFEMKRSEMRGGDPSRPKATEIVSLTEGESIPECLQELADHPNQNSDTAGGALPSAGWTKVLGLKLPMALK